MHGDELLRADLARLLAVEQIRARIHRCARALDRLDRALLEAQFWPDAKIDYGAFYQGSIQGFLDVAMRFQESMRDTQHFVANTIIEVRDETASAESYVHAHHVMGEGENLSRLEVGGRYLDHFARRENVWRLSYRTEILDWGRSAPISERWFDTNDELPKGKRNREDPSYLFL